MSMVPPNSQEAERAVLGSILIDAAQGIHHLRAAQTIITAPEMFYSEAHRTIWQAMLDVGEGLDSVTLTAKLKERGQLDNVGGQSYILGDLSQAVATAAHVEHYARIVARLHYERELTKEALRMADSKDHAHLETITALVLARHALDAPPVFDYATSLHDALDEITDPKREPLYRFNLKPLDDITDGLKKGEVNTFGAATNQGKSLLLLNLMDRQAQAGARCLFVGSEMTARETFARHLGMRSGIEAWKIRKGELSNADIGRATETISARLSTLPISILDDPEPSIEQIEATIARTRPDAVFVDYLERMQLPPAENLRLAVKEFMRRLKTMARKRNVIVFLASQLNRKTYQADNDAPPTLADLSESSAIEKESDRVFLIWRPKMLQPEVRPSVADYRAVLEIVKGKDRHGPNGLKAHLELDGRTLRLEAFRQAVGAAR